MAIFDSMEFRVQPTKFTVYYKTKEQQQQHGQKMNCTENDPKNSLFPNGLPLPQFLLDILLN